MRDFLDFCLASLPYTLGFCAFCGLIFAVWYLLFTYFG